MIRQATAKLSTRTLAAIIALGGGCIPAAAGDSEKNYVNNEYYGNIYGRISDFNNSNNDTNNGDANLRYPLIFSDHAEYSCSHFVFHE